MNYINSESAQVETFLKIKSKQREEKVEDRILIFELINLILTVFTRK